MNIMSSKAIAKGLVVAAREEGVDDHEVEEWASDTRVTEFVGAKLTSSECQSVRDEIMFLVG